MKNSIDIKLLIPSRAVREQCILENRVFDLREQATLVWNNPELKDGERFDLLRQILKQAKEDSKWKDLCEQIQERINIRTELERIFFATEEKQYYQIEHINSSTKKLALSLKHYSDLNSAKKYVHKGLIKHCLNGEYRIHKSYIDSDSERDIIAVFDCHDSLVQIYYLTDRSFWDDNSRFENGYVLIPHPFRMGDFVHTMGCEEIGIFRGCKNEADYQKEQAFHKELEKKGYSDFSDVCCTAEYLEPYYKNENQFCFSHDHPSLVNLEFAGIKEEDPHYELMKQAQSLVRGDGSLEMFTAEILKI